MLTSKEVAEILRVSQSFVAVLVRRGHFPGAIKIDPTRKNSHLRIPLQAVEEFNKTRILQKGGEAICSENEIGNNLT